MLPIVHFDLHLAAHLLAALVAAVTVCLQGILLRT